MHCDESGPEARCKNIREWERESFSFRAHRRCCCWIFGTGLNHKTFFEWIHDTFKEAPACTAHTNTHTHRQRSYFGCMYKFIYMKCWFLILFDWLQWLKPSLLLHMRIDSCKRSYHHFFPLSHSLTPTLYLPYVVLKQRFRVYAMFCMQIFTIILTHISVLLVFVCVLLLKSWICNRKPSKK